MQLEVAEGSAPSSQSRSLEFRGLQVAAEAHEARRSF